MDISRHTEIVKPWEHKTRITIIGVGATGSHLFYALINLGFTAITVIDFDTVESHNLANQMFNTADIGKLKVEALKDLYIAKTGEQPPEEMHFINGRVPSAEAPLEGIVFLLTDSMKSRKEIYEHEIKDSTNIKHVIETRMASTHGNVFSFCPRNKFQSQAWFNTLTDDETTEVSACGTSISVGMTAALIANLATWEFIHILTNDQCDTNQLDVFFKPVYTQRKNLE